MSGSRIRRVDEAVRAVLSDAITQELKDPRVGFVTVTAVRTSSDLRHARVYVSILGDEEARAAGLEGLRSAQGFLQRKVAAAVRMKYTPEITFAYDDSVDRGLRINELLRDLPPAERDEVAGDAARMDDSQHEEDA
ncbi:30S ribosome-binding factor RbfA [Conexibacter stalactiti]|uniref:Ribosome-binding factor A n=1 Tax=Conexibacter stalactiti TaxID=1940611 RepID=A0ABU4HPX5_9ACTN|nr:30S ribosome-binding factor RbfA [Conexibacter stalactiti]MDW5595371.1 30S ribosome-binding factor RbfA [Conexibacter stalactiti]MEC5036013.1 30S ribosome-binding factor RbfA [Conexibacter stalactiti]